MSAETNRASVRRFFGEVYNYRNLGILDEILDPDVVNHNTRVHGLEGAKLYIASINAKCPDILSTLTDTVADGDKVVVGGSTSFTHQSDGKQVSLSWIEILRLKHGNIVEAWFEADPRFFADQPASE